MERKDGSFGLLSRRGCKMGKVSNLCCWSTSQFIKWGTYFGFFVLGAKGPYPETGRLKEVSGEIQEQIIIFCWPRVIYISVNNNLPSMPALAFYCSQLIIVLHLWLMLSTFQHMRYSASLPHPLCVWAGRRDTPSHWGNPQTAKRTVQLIHSCMLHW